ncbi:unnamed protein product [Lampetra fluviatilis]
MNEAAEFTSAARDSCWRRGALASAVTQRWLQALRTSALPSANATTAAPHWAQRWRRSERPRGAATSRGSRLEGQQRGLGAGGAATGR